MKSSALLKRLMVMILGAFSRSILRSSNSRVQSSLISVVMTRGIAVWRHCSPMTVFIASSAHCAGLLPPFDESLAAFRRRLNSEMKEGHIREAYMKVAVTGFPPWILRSVEEQTSLRNFW